MRILASDALPLAAGGTGEKSATERALNICNDNNFPDSTRIEISVNNKGSVGISEFKISQNATVTIETTCGELREKSGGGT